MGEGINALARVVPQPHCFICGKQGQLLYKDLKDRLYSVPGEWSLVQCPDNQCGLIWLDPAPIKDDLKKLYVDYYTHSQQKSPGHKGNGIVDHFFSFMHKVIFEPGLNRYAYMFLRNEKPGRLLEIGCGDGERLKLMKSLGWEAIGVEVDPVACSVAERNSGCKVFSEELRQVAFKDNSFDALILCHVIEHVPDPVGLLSECLRILKPDGMLVFTTPNAWSLGHKFYKYYWYPLDPPRHLFILSPGAIKKICHKLEIEPNISTKTFSIGASLWSSAFKRGQSRLASVRSLSGVIFVFWEWLVQLVNKDVGEEIICFLTKKHP